MCDDARSTPKDSHPRSMRIVVFHFLALWPKCWCLVNKNSSLIHLKCVQTACKLTSRTITNNNNKSIVISHWYSILAAAPFTSQPNEKLRFHKSTCRSSWRLSARDALAVVERARNALECCQYRSQRNVCSARLNRLTLELGDSYAMRVHVHQLSSVADQRGLNICNKHNPMRKYVWSGTEYLVRVYK